MRKVVIGLALVLLVLFAASCTCSTKGSSTAAKRTPALKKTAAAPNLAPNVINQPNSTPLPLDLAIPESDCDSFCAICKRLSECKFEGGAERVNFEKCRSNCADLCKKHRLHRHLLSCMPAASDCAAMQRCFQ